MHSDVNDNGEGKGNKNENKTPSMIEYAQLKGRIEKEKMQ